MGGWRQRAWVLGVVALLGCQPPPPTDDRPPGTHCPPAAYDQEIPVAATSTTVPVNTRASVHTADGTVGASIDIDDNKGTVEFLGTGPMSAVISKRIPWPDVGTTLLEGLAVTDGVWFPFWLYCAPDGTLTAYFVDRTDSPAPFSQNVDGTCAQVAETWDMPLELPAHTLRNVAMTCGFAVSAPPSDAPLSLQGSKPGVLSIDGQPATALVFSTADCRAGSCGGSGSWFELHSILWQPGSGRVGFAVWYLEGELSGTGVFTNPVLMLPAGEWTRPQDPTATWTLPGN